jgi:hypothetical protein
LVQSGLGHSRNYIRSRFQLGFRDSRSGWQVSLRRSWRKISDLSSVSAMLRTRATSAGLSATDLTSHARVPARCGRSPAPPRRVSGPGGWRTRPRCTATAPGCSWSTATARATSPCATSRAAAAGAAPPGAAGRPGFAGAGRQCAAAELAGRYAVLTLLVVQAASCCWWDSRSMRVLAKAARWPGRGRVGRPGR